MFIELVDALRCPRDHEASWLVLGAEQMHDRHVMEGVLGCPVCRAQYRIANGIADLRVNPALPTRRPRGNAGPGAEQAMRLAAFLNLSDARGIAVLVGEWTAHAPGVRALADTPLLLVNPADGLTMGDGTSGLLADRVLPLAPRTARALAVDAPAGAAFLAQAVHAVEPKGRVVAPVGLPLPAGVSELAHDAQLWVAERDAVPSEFVALGRGRR